MQLLEDTLAVLSLTEKQTGKRIVCKTETFVPVVLPGLSSSSSASSSSTMLPQDSSVSSNPPSSRSDEGVSGNWRRPPKTQNKKKGDDQGAAGDRLRDLPEWLEDFTENLEDTEMPAPANISHDSDSERPMKVAPRNHSIYNHLPKSQNCEVCKQTKIHKGSLQKANWECRTSGSEVL